MKHGSSQTNQLALRNSVPNVCKGVIVYNNQYCGVSIVAQQVKNQTGIQEDVGEV